MFLRRELGHPNVRHHAQNLPDLDLLEPIHFRFGLANRFLAHSDWEPIVAAATSATQNVSSGVSRRQTHPTDEEYRPELARLSRAELMDVAWHLAAIVHDLADDPEGDMIELRCAIEMVQERRPSPVTLRRRD